MDQTRLGVGIVGTGRVGAVMGRALLEAGHAIVGCTAALTRAGTVLLPCSPTSPSWTSKR